MIRYIFGSLNKVDVVLWLFSVMVVLGSYIMSSESNALTLIASLIGVTALIYTAKGHVLGQVFVVIFSLLYAIISFEFKYYGEMITYIGMTTPIAITSIISWLKHPFEEKNEVEVASLSKKNIVIMILLAALVTFVFYFILKFFGTQNLVVSTMSITTSFLASYLMLFRIPSYALAYGANDMILIVLWVLASLENIAYFPMIICFVVFFINDVYGFYSWKKRKIEQEKDGEKTLFD